VLNSVHFLSLVSQEDCAGSETDDIHTVLGVEWNTLSDELSVLIPGNPVKSTKRVILSAIASIFDSFGIVVLFSLQRTLIFEEVCNYSWASPLPTEINGKCEVWFGKINQLRVTISRCNIPRFIVESIQMHFFCGCKC